MHTGDVSNDEEAYLGKLHFYLRDWVVMNELANFMIFFGFLLVGFVMPKPNLLIVGCQKCGTTWLHTSLSRSSFIFGSEIKELDFFNKVDFMDSVDSYVANFPESPKFSYYMESTPHYFQKPVGRVNVANNIKSYLDNPQVIVIFRNPVDRYESAYIHHMMKERIPYQVTIDEMVNDNKMLELGEYAGILRYWKSVFPDIIVVFYDDLVEDAYGFVDSVMEKLELDNDIAKDSLMFRTNDKHIKAKKLGWPSMPQLTGGLKDRLLEYYLDDIYELENITGRSLQHWRSL